MIIVDIDLRSQTTKFSRDNVHDSHIQCPWFNSAKPGTQMWTRLHAIHAYGDPQVNEGFNQRLREEPQIISVATFGIIYWSCGPIVIFPQGNTGSSPHVPSSSLALKCRLRGWCNLSSMPPSFSVLSTTGQFGLRCTCMLER